ncbi:MAG TPA: LemA family protein [Rhizomicrobium sp.]|nr:LemA family protein [Rhizomicrobium sp.]
MFSSILKQVTRLTVVAAMVAGLSGCGINAVPTQDEQVKAAWSQVLNEYQRRSDLIPNLVQTVKGYAAQEKSVLIGVTEARAKATQMTMSLPADVTSNPQAFHQFEQTQSTLGASIGRLLAVSEKYPDLKSNENFMALQSQLEGTENRITVARKDYIDAVQTYNTTLRTIPSRWIAAIFYPDAKVKETFTISEKAQEAPKVSF